MLDIVQNLEKEVLEVTQNKTSQKQKMLEKLNEEAKKELKVIQEVSRKFYLEEKKLQNTLHKIKNIDEYMLECENKRSSSKHKGAKVKINTQEQDNE